MELLDKITEIYCLIDDFCIEFNKARKDHILSSNTSVKTRNKPCAMSDSEVITILIFFHLQQYRNLKHYYIHYIQKHMTKDFPKTVSYNRFVELQQKAMLPMVLFLKTSMLGKCTGITFVDSTQLKVCHIKREHNHKVFKGIATKGKTSTGWFFGFKLHLVVNDKGEVLNFVITQANVDDRTPLTNTNLLKHIFGKLFGDKGYLSQTLSNILFVDGIHLVTKLRKNMKGALTTASDMLYSRKRCIIETINDELKNICQIEHSRHRSFANFLSNMIAGLIAYCILPKKPSIKLETIESNQLMLF